MSAQAAVAVSLMDALVCSTLWWLSSGVMSGAIYMNANGSLTVDGEVAFVNNTAGSDGGEHPLVPAE